MRSAASKSLPVIRPLTAADLGQVISIERASYPFPWTKGIFEDCLKVGYSCFGGMIDGQLVAYEVHNRGADEAHLLTSVCILSFEAWDWAGCCYSMPLTTHGPWAAW